MSKPVARLGDPSNHGGVIISSASRTMANGILVARMGDLHVCPIPGHGATPIVTGSNKTLVGGETHLPGWTTRQAAAWSSFPAATIHPTDKGAIMSDVKY